MSRWYSGSETDCFLVGVILRAGARPNVAGHRIQGFRTDLHWKLQII